MISVPAKTPSTPDVYGHLAAGQPCLASTPAACSATKLRLPTTTVRPAEVRPTPRGWHVRSRPWRPAAAASGAAAASDHGGSQDVGGILFRRGRQLQQLIGPACRPAGRRGPRAAPDARRSGCRSCRRPQSGSCSAVPVSPPFLMMMPAWRPCPCRPTNATGAAMSSGHGVATTRTSANRPGSPLASQASAGQDKREEGEGNGVTVRHPDQRGTAGRGLLHQRNDPAVLGIRHRGDACIRTAEAPLTEPLMTWSPAVFSTGRLSPVRADSSKDAGRQRPARRQPAPPRRA